MAFPIIPYDGLNGFMDIVMFSIQGGRLTSRVKLFSNDYAPDIFSVPASFVETTAGGMLGQSLPVPVNNGVDIGGRDIWIFPGMTFTANGLGLPAVFYGYWVECQDPITAQTRVLWSQRFQAPQVAIAAGNTVKFALSLGGKQC